MKFWTFSLIVGGAAAFTSAFSSRRGSPAGGLLLKERAAIRHQPHQDTTRLNAVFSDLTKEIVEKASKATGTTPLESSSSSSFVEESKSSSFNTSSGQQQQFQPPEWLEGIAWRSVIMVLCALWASNFAAAKLVMAEPGVDSSLYAVSRFSVAALALLPGAIASARKIDLDWDTIKASTLCGCWVAFGYLGQTLGLMTTTASKSCVICSLHCVFVATIAEIWRVQRATVETSFDPKRLIPAILAVLGVGIIELQGAGGDPTIGDLLSFAQPIGFGMGYLQLEEIMSEKPEAALPVSFLKLAVVAVASLGMFELSPLLHSGLAGLDQVALQIPDFGAIFSSETARYGILYTGLITTALALWVESKAFAKVPATDASIILTTEPLIAALFGAIALGETFGSSDYVGAGMIVAACVAATLLDNPPQGPDGCVIGVDEDCEPERTIPFFGP
jgi:drug/metabolite transporter (DMT)-like permease